MVIDVVCRSSLSSTFCLIRRFSFRFPFRNRWSKDGCSPAIRSWPAESTSNRLYEEFSRTNCALSLFKRTILVGMRPRPSQNIIYCGVVEVLQPAPVRISLGSLTYKMALDFRLHILDPPVHYIGELVYVLQNRTSDLPICSTAP